MYDQYKYKKLIKHIRDISKRQKERRIREYYRKQPKFDIGDQGFAGKIKDEKK